MHSHNRNASEVLTHHSVNVTAVNLRGVHQVIREATKTQARVDNDSPKRVHDQNININVPMITEVHTNSDSPENDSEPHQTIVIQILETANFITCLHLNINLQKNQHDSIFRSRQMTSES